MAISGTSVLDLMVDKLIRKNKIMHDVWTLRSLSDPTK
jgi:hypothetical protein